MDKIKGSYKCLKLFFVDMDYLGEKTLSLVKSYGRNLKILKKSRKWRHVIEGENIGECVRKGSIEFPASFKVLPKRWILELTFAWLNKFRRLSKDYEYLIETSEATLLLAMSRIILKRLS